MSLREFIHDVQLANEFRDPVVPLDHWDSLHAAIEDDRHHLVVYSAPSRSASAILLAADNDIESAFPLHPTINTNFDTPLA